MGKKNENYFFKVKRDKEDYDEFKQMLKNIANPESRIYSGKVGLIK